MIPAASPPILPVLTHLMDSWNQNQLPRHFLLLSMSLSFLATSPTAFVAPCVTLPGRHATVVMSEEFNTMGMEDVGLDMLFDAMDAAEDEVGGPKVDEVFGAPIFNIKTLPGITAPLGFFDPLDFCSAATEGRQRFYREVELKHGRVAMLASLGFLVGENFHPLFGGDVDVPSYIAFQATPLQTFWPAVVFAIAIPEVLSVFSFNGPAEGFEPWSIKKGHVAGDLGFDPLGLKPTTDGELAAMQTKELNNGRLAMIGAAGMIAQEYVSGQKLF